MICKLLNIDKYKVGYGLKIYVLLVLLNVSSIIQSQNKKLKLPKSYIAYYTNEAIVVDGRANEDSWNKSIWTDDFIDIEGTKIPKYQTRVKMLWDNTYLYFYVEMVEPHIWGDIMKRDEVIFYNNDFEVFIDPDGDAHNYMEFEINALNTVWDLFLSKPYRDFGTVLDNWNINGLKTSVYIDGTLNDSSDKDKKWFVEIAMPWDVLTEASKFKKVPKGRTWRINFSRVNWNFDLVNGKYHRKKDPKTNKYLSEYNWVWSPQGVINMHEPEKWGYVYFSDKYVGEQDVFVYGKDEEIKQKLYELYRAQRNYFNIHHKWNKEIVPASIKVNREVINLTFEMNALGYMISVKSPFTEKKLYMSEDGKLIVK